MKLKSLGACILATGCAFSTANATASDGDLAAAIILGGTGAVLGHAIGGADGAVIGGFLGAVLGAVAAEDHGGYTDYGYRPRYYRRPPQYVIVAPPPPPPRWRGNWRQRQDHRWHEDDWRYNDRYYWSR